MDTLTSPLPLSPVPPKKRVLIVGAGGFAGSWIVDEALRRGLEVWAGIRRTTSKKWLGQEGINFLYLDFENPSTMPDVLSTALPPGEKWDWIVYNLGATKCLRFSDFSRINYEYLRSFTAALHASGMVPEKMLYMSSLSVMGPGDEKGYAPFDERGIPRPDTRYGTSKLKAETWLATAGIPCVIFRPTGIYGPRDHDYFLMIESIAKGFDFSVGYRKQMLTFLYAGDLARAVFDALMKAPAGETYCLAENRAYTQKEFRKIVCRGLGKRFALPVVMPLWAVKAVSAVAEKIGVMRLKPSTLNRDKYHIMRQRNWNVDTSKARRDFGFEPQTSLEEGIGEAIDWYRAEGWLK